MKIERFKLNEEQEIPESLMFNSRAKQGEQFFLAEKTISIKILTNEEMDMLLSAHKYNL